MKLFIAIFFAMNIQNFEIIDIQSYRINEMINSAIEHEICEFNSANIYRLKFDKYLIVPIEGKYAILYSDLNTLKSHIENKFFPIEKLESDSIYEIEKRYIENIEDNELRYINHIIEKFDLDEKDINNKGSSIENVLSNLNNKINSYGYQNLSNYDIFSVGIYVSTLFKVKTSTYWGLNKVFTLNTYWIPIIVSEEKVEYDIIGSIYNSIKEHNFLDLVYSYRKEMAKFHGFKKPLSKEYLSYISTGKLGNGVD